MENGNDRHEFSDQQPPNDEFVVPDATTSENYRDPVIKMFVTYELNEGYFRSLSAWIVQQSAISRR
jgi:hypothetical protein